VAGKNQFAERLGVTCKRFLVSLSPYPLHGFSTSGASLVSNAHMSLVEKFDIGETLIGNDRCDFPLF
jgi:hypothetical protein